jgi:uncharacterized protein (TIGR02594 family)
MKLLTLSIFLCFLSACTININSYNSVPTIDIASEWIGLHQNSDRLALQEFMGVDPVRTEWCAAFVNSVLAEAGLPGSETVHRYPLLARSFLNWGNAVKPNDIQPGDVVIFPRGWKTWMGHVGFYVETVWIDGVEYWAILGGNQRNSVSIDLYPASRAIGIRRMQKPPALQRARLKFNLKKYYENSMLKVAA